MTNVNSLSPAKPKSLKLMAILLVLTFMRAMMGTQIPTLEMFGGVHPDAWFAPWISDAILGILVPYMIYLLLKKRGVNVWATLLVYNAVGAFDYVHGLLTQWTDPLIPNGMMGNPGLTYGSVAFSLVVQLTVIYLLTRNEVKQYFLGHQN